MSIVLIVLLVVAVLIAALFAYATTKPDTFRVERVTRVNAPPEKLFAYIQDFHAWKTWSPYEGLDAALVRTYSGAASGKGAVYEWSGNAKAGAGRMEILAAAPTRVTIALEFSRPFKAKNTAEFVLERQGEVTQVTWSTSGPSPLSSKVMQVVIDMDKLVGKDFEKGLASMKQLAEA